MTREEAKFILSAYRPDGSDAADASFGEALHMAAADPSLAAWLEASRALDRVVAGKLAQVPAPAGLREAILAGARVCGARRREGPGRFWIAGLAAAAALAIVVVSMESPSRQSGPAFAAFAIEDTADHRHGGTGEPSTALIRELETEGAPMPGASTIDFDLLTHTGCRTVSFAGRPVIEVCFVRDGALFHLYVVRRGALRNDQDLRTPEMVSEAAGSAAVWSDPQYDYALVSKAGVEAIRRLL